MSLARNRVWQGDCLKLLRDVEDAQVNLVFADPPFNIGYDYDVYEDRRQGDEYVAWCRQWIQEIRRVLTPTGSFWLAIGDEFAAELKLVAQNDAGFTCRSWVIWYYTFGVNCVRGFSRSHTHLFHFVCDPRNFTFNGDNPATRVPSARQLVYADLRANPKGRLPDNTWIFRPQDGPAGSFAPHHDTWYFARVAGTFKEREGFHGCQMPEQLLGRIIRLSSHPRDLVLDPFAGSGTTLVVAKKLGRQWLGCELSKSYARRIQTRLDKTQVGDHLDGPEDPVRSAPKTSQGRSNGRVTGARMVPALDADSERGILAAYQDRCRGETTDTVLCNPELNDRFLEACKQRGIAGGPYVWNRALLRIRKSGKVPSRGAPQHRLRCTDMDHYSFASEIAMQTFAVNYQMTIDELLCDPTIASEFDGVAADFAPGYSPFQYRWAALAIRKRAKISKDAAASKYARWNVRQLPKRTPIAKFRAPDTPQSGVYVLSSESASVLYVGETLHIQERLAQLLRPQSPWVQLGLSAIQFVTVDGVQMQHGLQSRIISETSSLLNSDLLRLRDAAARA